MTRASGRARRAPSRSMPRVAAVRWSRVWGPRGTAGSGEVAGGGPGAGGGAGGAVRAVGRRGPGVHAGHLGPGVGRAGGAAGADGAPLGLVGVEQVGTGP